MEREHETTVNFYVETKKHGSAWRRASPDLGPDGAKAVCDSLRSTCEVRIIKETVTTVREVVDE